MSDDVLITPGSRKIEFKDSSANVDAKIETDSSGNLIITNTGGDITIGDTTSDIFVGDGTANVDIVFEQAGEIRGTTGVTVTLGASDSNIRMATDLNLNSNNITNVNDLTVAGNLTVSGTTTTVNSTNTTIADRLIELGNGTTGTPANDMGLVFERGSSDNVFIGWDESNDRVAVGTGSFTGASSGDLSFTRAGFAAGAGDFSSISSSGNISGNGANITSLNASNISSGTINTARLPNPIHLSGSNAILKLQETDVTNSPTWWHVADGGSYSIRLNNTGSYPIQITTDSDNDAVTFINFNYTVDLNSQKLQFGSETTSYIQNVNKQGTDVWRFQTEDGLIEIGSENSSWAHFGTDRNSFYFNPKITVDGNVEPYTDSTRSLGTSSLRWANVYADTLYGDGSNITGVTATDSTKMPLAGGTFTGGTTYNVEGNAITISSAAPQIRLNDTTSGADDFWIHVNSDRFYILADRGDDGSWETPYPLELNASTNVGYIFAHRAFTEDYHPNADKWTTARTITLGGDLTGNVSIDGSANVTLTAAVVDDSHNHVISNVDGLQTALDAKLTSSSGLNASNLTSGTVSTARLAHPTSGDWWKGGPPLVATDGVMEIGKYIDFHNTDTTTADFDTRLYSSGTNQLTINGAGRILTTADEGSGNGIDADTVDNIHASSFKRNDQTGSTAEFGPWYSTTTYVYDATNGTRFYWNLLGTISASSCRGSIEYEAKDDENYPHFVKGTITFSGFNSGASFSVQHDQHTQDPFGVQVRLDTSRRIWIRIPNCDWAHYFRFRVHNQSGNFTTNTSWSTGSSRYDTAGSPSSPPNASSDILSGQNLRATSSSVTGSVPSYNNYNYFGRVYARDSMEVNGNTVWHAGNDGSSSGLDADTLDTYHASSFVIKGSASVNTPSNITSFTSNDAINTSTGSQSGLQVYQDTVGADAFMTFHIGNDYAGYFGLDGGINDFAVGGWSFGANSYRVFHAGNSVQFTSALNTKLSGIATGADVTPSWVPSSNPNYLTGNQTITLSGDVSGSGTTSISVSITDDSHFHHRLDSTDDRDMKPSTSGIAGSVQALKPFFSSFGGMTGSADTTYVDVLAFDTYSDSSGGGPSAITFHKGAGAGDPKMYIWKAGWNATTWSTGQRVFADNYHPNADTLTTARTIGGVSFNGSANINLPGVNTAGNQNTSGTAAGLSGTPNISVGTITATTSGTNTVTIDGTGSYTLRSYHDSGGVGWATGSGSSWNNLLYLDDNNDFVRIYSGQAERARFNSSGIDARSGGFLINGTTVIDSSRNLTNIGNITSTGNSTLTGSGSSGNAFVVNRGGGSQQQALRVQNSGEVVVSNNYLYCSGTGTAFYVQGGAVFRGGISNDTSGQPVTFNDDVSINGDITINNTEVINQTSGDLLIGDITNNDEITKVELFAYGGTSKISLQDGEIYYNGNSNSNAAFKMDSQHFHSNGDVIAYSSTLTASDRRLKENIQALEDPLNKVLNLQGVKYDWKEEGRGKNQIGLIAQEVEEIIPEVVNEIGNSLGKLEDMKVVNYSALVPVLIEAIKEQQKQIEELKKHSHPAKDMCDFEGYEELVARINKLENKNGNN